jgi:DedD protein
MDSRAKQRLTGAIILVAIFVLLVPELLTGPRSSDSTTQSQSEEGLRRYTIDLDGHAPASTIPPTNSPAVELPPVAQRATPGEVAMPEVPVPETEVPRTSAPPAAAPAPAVAAPNNVAAAEPKPAVETPASPVQSAVAPHPAATNERGNFAVQLGSFGSRENADRLVRDMTAKGFTAFVAPITSGGRELYRVRVGPARDRSAAEALAAQLRRVGQSGSIVPIS